jgi:hypothetical protein
MIGRADIEGSKSDVAMNAWPPQASSLLPVSFGNNIDTFMLLSYAAGRHDTLSGGSSPYLKQRVVLQPLPTP